MKRYPKILITLFLLATLALFLSSCRVNLVYKSIDAPWYYIAVPVAVIFVITHFKIVRSHYRCPHCGKVFRPKWYEISSWIHMGGKRIMKCPECGNKDFCEKI